MAAVGGIKWNDNILWQLTIVGSFTAEEHKYILKLCVPNIGVLLKGKKECVSIFVSKNSNFLSILTAINIMRKQLTCCQKDLN